MDELNKGFLGMTGVRGPASKSQPTAASQPDVWRGWGPKPEAVAHYDLALLNDSIVPAALAATAYSDRCWALDVGAGLVDPMAWADQKLGGDRNAFARSMLIAKTCKALSQEDLKIDPSESGSTLRGGVWRNGDLASALACVRTKEDGTKELQLSIRGTDVGNNPNPATAIFQTLAGYLLWTFPSIDKYAAKFTQLADAMREYAADPANGISKVVVSGHSLGAAAAERLLPRLASPGVKVEMFGFGSPGHGSGVRAPLLAVVGALLSGARLVAGGAALTAELASGAMAWAGRLAGDGPMPAFSALARLSARKLEFAAHGLESVAYPAVVGVAAPARFIQFRHPDDFVPKIGSLLYSTAGRVEETYRSNEFVLGATDSQSTVREITGVKAHSADRYASYILQMAKSALWRCPPGTGQNSPACDSLRDMARAQVDTARLYASVAMADLPAAVQSARVANVAALTKRDPTDPTIARILALDPPNIASKLSMQRAMRAQDARYAAESLLGGVPADLDPKKTLPQRLFKAR